MELVHAHQITFDELLNEKIDVLIAACGYEQRCSHLIQMSNIKATRKIALLFKENTDKGSRQANEAMFKEKGFECFELSSNSAEEIKAVLQSICDGTECEDVKLLVDYSSMSRVWYGSIINFLIFNDLYLKNLVVYFSYTPEHYVPVKRSNTLSNPTPVFVNSSKINTQKPVALVIGLGFDERKVNFLNDFFKAETVNLFLPSSSFNEDYTKDYKECNKNIVSTSNPHNLYYYSATNMEEIDAKLTSICMNLRTKYRVVLVSLGPKTFSLTSFLLNAKYPDIEIWSMSDNSQVIDLKPDGLPLVYKAILTEDNEEY